MKAVRWLSLIAGILLVILGAMCLGTPVENLLAVSLYICISLLVYGIFEIVAYFSFDPKFRSGWLLASGILSVLISLWMLFSRGSIVGIAMILPYIFSIWLMASSLVMAIDSFQLKRLGIPRWGWTLAAGIIGVILGFLLILNPISSALTISFVLAFYFIYQGISNIIFFFVTRKH